MMTAMISFFLSALLVLTSVGNVVPFCPIGVTKRPGMRQDREHSCKIFLDHGGHYFHAEVFYPTAVMLATRHWPNIKLIFVVHRKFARMTGLNMFWRLHASEGVLGNDFRFEFVDMPGYRPLANCVQDSNNNPAMLAKCSHNKQYNARVVVTVPLGWREEILCPLKNNPMYVFIVHHAEVSSNTTAMCNGVSREIIQWKNSYVAGQLVYLRSRYLHLNDFTPHALSIHPYPSALSTRGSASNEMVPAPATPHIPAHTSTGVSTSSSTYRTSPYCHGKVPVAIVQGEISGRRDLSEIESILKAGGQEIYVKVLTRSPPLINWVRRETWRGEWIQNANMTAFHKAFQGAAFLVAGMSPNLKQNYFQGHPSSNIAYALHFGLQIIGHEAIPQEYLALNTPFPGGEPAGFWHNGSKASIVDATVEAITAWRRRCL